MPDYHCTCAVLHTDRSIVFDLRRPFRNASFTTMGQSYMGLKRV
jgi:hypothetical protein